MRIIATIEARMTSSRLPGKVLLPAGGKPMLGYLVNRLKQVNSIQEIVLATTVNDTDNCLIEFAKKQGISFFRGSENDVMSRVIGAAESVDAEVIVQITGDCPIIDPSLVEQTIQIYKNNVCDYASNSHIRSYPDGMDVSVFKLETLKKSLKMTKDPLDHEHVTLHIRKNPDLFSHMNLVAPPEMHWPELGLTLDELTDYELIKRIIEYFGDEKPYFGLADIIQLLKAKPDWAVINQGVKRKGNT